MNIIPHIRLIFVLVGLGILYWLFSNILTSVTPVSIHGDPFYMIMHAIWAFFIMVIMFISIARYFIEIKRKVSN